MIKKLFTNKKFLFYFQIFVFSIVYVEIMYFIIRSYGFLNNISILMCTTSLYICLMFLVDHIKFLERQIELGNEIIDNFIENKFILTNGYHVIIGSGVENKDDNKDN